VVAEVPVSLARILILFVLVAALGTYLYVYEIPQAEKEGQKEKLVAIDKDGVTGVTLTYPDREIELKKDDHGWRIVKPVDAPADEVVVKGVIATVSDAEVQKTLDQVPSDLAPFGLDKPTATVRLTAKDGTQTPPIAVGKNTAIGGKTYVRKDDEPKLYLTTSTVGFGLNKQVKDLRDKQIMVFQDDAVASVDEMPAGEQAVTVTRKDKDAWVVDPGNHPADPTEVRSYLSSVRAVRATDFPDDHATDLAKYGLDRPRLTVRVNSSTAGAPPLTLLLGSETTEGSQKLVYAKREDQPIVYALGDWTVRTLTKSAAQFRDKTVLGFDPARVGGVVVERKDGGGATLKRTDAGWQMDGTDKAVKPDAVTRFLDDFRDLRGSDVVAEPPGDLGRFGLDAPDLRVTLNDKDGQPLGTVVASRKDTKYYAMATGGPTVFEVRDYMYTRLDKRQSDFLDTPQTTAPTTPKVVPAEPGGDEDDGAGGDEE
jgi:uncharacterized protein DUF4340